MSGITYNDEVLRSVDGAGPFAEALELAAYERYCRRRPASAARSVAARAGSLHCSWPMKRMLMAVPDFQSMMRPVLALHADGLPHPSADVRDAVAQVMGITEEDRQVPLPSGRTSRYANRVAWAVTHMAQALLLERPTRGVTQITSRGREVLAKHPDRVDMNVLAQFPEYLEFRSGSRRHTRKEPDGRPPSEEPAQQLSPAEAITEVIDEAHLTVAGDLLARICSSHRSSLNVLS